MNIIDEAYEEFVRICGQQHVLFYCEDISDYGRDQTLGLVIPFDLLVRPGSSGEVSNILKVCNEHRIAVTPRGGGSGVSGGTLPLTGGVLLSLERLNNIICINEIDGYVIAESGVVVSDLCDAVEAKGYYYPAAPSSKSFSFIGGNVATNAGSIHSCLYGKTGNYVINLEVVLPDGEIVWTGANVNKSSSGLNLTQLFVGSEGLLGVITKVVYRILPKQEEETMVLAAFQDLNAIIDALLALKRSGISLSVGEFICPKAIAMVSEYLAEPLALARAGACYHLLVGFRSNSFVRDLQLGAIANILEAFTDIELLVSQTWSEKDQLMKLRNNIGRALVSNGGAYRDIDASVPVSALYSYLLKIESIADVYHVPFISFGHALDGNLHVMLRKESGKREEMTEKEAKVLSEIYSFVADCGGVISGEHGIGSLQREFLKFQYPPKNIKMMKEIKQLLDPNGILNQGKVL